MKKLLILLFSLAGLTSYAQVNTFGGIGLRVNDTTTYQTNAAAYHTAGYYDIYFNNQATNDHWDVWNGSVYDHIFDFDQVVDAITNGVTTTAPTQNAVFDALALKAPLASPTFTGTPTLPVGTITDDETYGSGWNADVAPASKNAVYDKIEASLSISQASVSTASSTITLDMGSLNAKSFYGSATFSGPKTLAMSNVNDGCACLLSFNFWFEVTNVAAVLTWPADWFSSDANFNGTTWTPPAVGIYEMGGSYNDSANRWSIKISNQEQ